VSLQEQDIKTGKIARLKAVFSLKRTLIHFPVGVISAVCLVYMPSLGWAILVAFMAYELTEDWRIRDCSYIDINGFLAGLCVAAVVLLPSHVSWI
jgi:hypothetical protein